MSLARMRCVQNIEEQRVVVPVPQIRKETGEETQRIQQVRVAERSVEHRCTRTADPGQRAEVQRDLKSDCSNTVEYGVSSSDEFEKLRKQAEIAKCMAKEASQAQTVRRL